MAVSQLKAQTKASGGRIISSRKKRYYELGSNPTMTKLGEPSKTPLRVRGAHVKIRMLHADTANVYDPKSKKYQNVKIKNIVENPANAQLIRRNVMTKGAVVETEIGKARITSRPGQHGTVNAVLV